MRMSKVFPGFKCDLRSRLKQSGKLAGGQAGDSFEDCMAPKRSQALAVMARPPVIEMPTMTKWLKSSTRAVGGELELELVLLDADDHGDRVGKPGDL